MKITSKQLKQMIKEELDNHKHLKESTLDELVDQGVDMSDPDKKRAAEALEMAIYDAMVVIGQEEVEKYLQNFRLNLPIDQRG